MTNIVMLVRNRPRLTKQALDSLRPTRDRAVTVLDDRSDAETVAVLSAERQRLLHIVRNETPMGTGELRNLSVRANEEWFGRYDYLYLSDNDVLFLPGWLNSLIMCYEIAWHHGYRVIGAYNHPFHQHGERINCVDRDVFKVNALATQSMLMRWEVWDKYGPFCQTPIDKVCQSEDVDFCNRITADGFKVGVVSPNLVVSTGITNTFGEKIPGWELVKAQCPGGIICE